MSLLLAIVLLAGPALPAQDAQARLDGGPAPGAEPRPGPLALKSPADVFAQKLMAAVVQELEVQEYEWSTLGLEDPAKLQSFRLKRYQRMEQDKAEFVAKKSQFATKPLEIPRPQQPGQLPRKALTLLTSLRRAYEASRNARSIDLMAQANSNFLRTGDWVQRDQAVNHRDEIIEREIQWTQLFRSASSVARGTADDALVDELVAAVEALAPQTDDGGSDLAEIVLHNESVRATVLAEVQAILSQAPEAPPQPRTEEDLLPLLGEAWGALEAAAGISEEAARYVELRQEQAAIDIRLEEDQLLDSYIDLHRFAKNKSASKRDRALKLDNAARDELQERNAEIVEELAGLRAEWHAHEVPLPESQAVAALQDELIRRRVLDLGSIGSLYGPRYRLLTEDAERAAVGAMNGWAFLDEQRDLLEAIAEAGPEFDPLDGLAAPPSPAQLQANKQALAKLKKAPAKPQGGKSYGQGKGSFTKKFQAPKKHAPPKKKKGGKKKY